MPKKVQVVVMHIEGQLAWRAFRDTSTGMYIGVCDALAMTARGETWSDLNEDINDIVQLLLRDLLQQNKFQAFLRKRGWQFHGTVPARTADVRFDLPMPIQMGSAGVAAQA